MNSSDNSSIPFKSKKPTKSTRKHKTPAKVDAPTPDKPEEHLTRRLRNRNVALSIKEVRMAAEGSNLRRSARRKIESWIDEPEAGQSRKAGCDSVDVKVKEETSVKLPKEYELLGEFFDNLDNSIRLLRLKQTMCTFSNLSQKIELLTDRRFTLQNLAQLKYLLPEAIELKKVLKFDEQINCMKPELHVAINVDAINLDGNVKVESKNLQLRKLFRERLVDFCNSHPEGTEVPEEMLPEPFNHSQSCLSSDEMKEPMPTPAETSFDVIPGQGITCLPVTASKVAYKMDNLSVSPAKSVTFCSTPVKPASTPAKLASTPARLMSSTPEVVAPKRSILSPEADLMSSSNKLVMRARQPRALKFETPVKNRLLAIADESSNDRDDSDISNILPESLLQSIREKEIKAKEEQDPAISQAKRRRRIISRLPGLFDSLHYLFQSIKKSVITKKELIYKITIDRVDLVDEGEVEEYLKLMIELAPDWIYEKTAYGDQLVCINKMTCPQTIRARLQEAR